MAEVCPTITALDMHEYRAQMDLITPFANRIHIDLMDGDFAPTRSPEMSRLWLPHGIRSDVHAMFRRPMDFMPDFVKLRPHMVIIHAEADVHHMHFSAELHKEGIKSGLCITASTPLENVEQIISSFDHLLIFSGNLGYHGGQANLGLLDKVTRALELHPDLEIGWDGGVNLENVECLARGGISVLNVGSAIHNSPEPAAAFLELSQLANK